MNCSGLANDRTSSVSRCHLSLEKAQVIFGLPLFQDLINAVTKLEEIERLQDVVVSSSFEGIHGSFDGAVACHNQKASVAVYFAHLPKQANAINTRHLQIADDQINVVKRLKALNCSSPIFKT